MHHCLLSLFVIVFEIVLDSNEIGKEQDGLVDNKGMVQYPFGRAISDPFHHISHTLVGAPDEHNGRPATPLGPHSILVHEEEDNGQADHQLEVEHDEQQV